MNIIKFNDVPFEKSDDSPVGIRDYVTTRSANFATAVINGRYPPEGDSANLEAEMYIYVASGMGSIAINGIVNDIRGGDLVVVESNELYHYENCEALSVAMFSTPPFDASKYVHISSIDE